MRPQHAFCSVEAGDALLGLLRQARHDDAAADGREELPPAVGALGYCVDRPGWWPNACRGSRASPPRGCAPNWWVALPDRWCLAPGSCAPLTDCGIAEDKDGRDTDDARLPRAVAGWLCGSSVTDV